MAFAPLGLIGPESTDHVAQDFATSIDPPLGVVDHPDSDDSNSPRAMAQNIRPLGIITADSDYPIAQRPKIDWTVLPLGPPLGLIGLDSDGGDNPYNGIRQRGPSPFAPTVLLEDNPNADASDMEKRDLQQEAAMEGLTPQELHLSSFIALNEGSPHGH